jgi:hypothetical protein
VSPGEAAPARTVQTRLTETIPPEALDAERAVLGLCLLETDAVALARRRLTPDAFYQDGHRLIFAAIVSLAERGEPIDFVIVNNELKQHGQSLDVGGPSTLTGLVEEVTNGAATLTHLDRYCGIVTHHAVKRELAALGAGLVDGAYDPGADPAALLEDGRARLGELATRLRPAAPGSGEYIEPIAAFLAEEDRPAEMLFPDLLPCGVTMLIHGEPRARKSLAAFELALAAATGTAPFGLDRFRPPAPVPVLYVQEEDPRALTRHRLRRLVRERAGAHLPTTLHVAVRRGIDLDDAACVDRLIADLVRLEAKLLVLDAARRLSALTDEGPAKVRALVAVLRSIIAATGVTLVIVHHDVKPSATSPDLRRRSQRASGGDWFAACECPVHIERVNETESLVFPQDFKFAPDPAPFTFRCVLDGRLIKGLIGKDATIEHAETAGERGRLLDWLRTQTTPRAKSVIREAGFRRDTLDATLDALCRDGHVDAISGRKAGTYRYFAVKNEPGSDTVPVRE